MPSLSGCDRTIPDPRVEVEQATVILPVVPGRPGSAYFTLRTNNDPTKLVSVTIPDVARIALHRSVTEGGIARMAPLDGVTFDDEGRLRFAPGGSHAMLFGISPKVKAGDAIRLIFTFDPAPAVTAEAEVRAFGGDE